MNKDEILLNVFIEREELKNKISKVRGILKEITVYHYAIGAPFNENTLKFNNKQLHYLRSNLDSIECSLDILETKREK